MFCQKVEHFIFFMTHVEMKLLTQEHEQALVKAIARLEEASDGETGNVTD